MNIVFIFYIITFIEFIKLLYTFLVLYRQKLLRGEKVTEENVARKISQLSQLFLPQQYNFSQFASFSSCNLYSKGSNRCPHAYYFFDFFRTTPTRLPYMLLIPTTPTPLFINIFEFVRVKKCFFIYND